MKGRWIRILSGGLLLAVASFLAAGVHFDGDIGRLLPDSDPGLRKTRAVVGRAMQRMVLDLGLPEEREDRLEVLMGAADSLAERLGDSEMVEQARAAMLDENALEATELLVQSVPRLLDPVHYSEIEERLAGPAIHDSLEGLRRRAHEPDAGWLLQEALRDPFGISGFVLSHMEGLLAGFQDVRLVQGYITTSDGSHLLMFVDPAVPATDTAASVALLEELDGAIADLKSQEGFGDLQVRHLGAHRSTLDNQDSIESDVLLTSLVGGLIVALIAILTLARTWWGLLAMTPALFGGVIALAVFSLFRDSIAAPVIGFGVALLGISIDYSIHVLYRLNAGGEARLPTRALFMGATTTACAFLALGVSSMPALREVGVLGAIGIVASAGFAVVVLPALAGTNKAGVRSRFNLQAVLRRRSPASSKTALLGIGMLSLVLAVGVFRLQFDGDVARLSRLSEVAAADEEGIKSTWGEAFQTAQVVVGGNDFQAALEQNETVLEVLEDLRAEGAIRDFGSISSFLPTVAEQSRRLEAWRTFWTAERVSSVRDELTASCEDLGFNLAAFDPFFEWVSSDPVELSYELERPNALDSLVRDRVIAMDAQQLVTTPVFVSDWGQVEATMSAIGEALPSAAVISNEALSRRLAEMVVGELWKLGLCAFLTVVLIVWIWLRSWRHSLLVILPLLLSSVWTLGALGWLGVPINLANSVFAGFLFGIAVDYAIFMVRARIEEARGEAEDVLETDASVLLCAITTSIGFGALVLASHPVLHSIGVTALVGILASFFATRLLVPPLSRRLLAGSGSIPKSAEITTD